MRFRNGVNRYSVHTREEFRTERCRKPTGKNFGVTLGNEKSAFSFVFRGVLRGIKSGGITVRGISPRPETLTKPSED